MASVTPSFATQAKTLDEELIAKVIINILTADEFTAQLPMEGIEGYRYIAPIESDLGPAGWTDPGTAVCIGYGEWDQVTAVIRRITADVSLDELVASHTSNPFDTWSLHIGARGKHIGRIWAQGLIGGTDSNGQIKGLRTAIPEAQTTDQGSTPGVPLDFDLMDTFLDKIEFKPDFIIMSKAMRRVYRKLLRNLDLDPEHVILNGLQRDGRIGEVRQMAYDGIPIFVNDWMTSFTYKGGTKHDIIAGVFGPQGVTGFYNRRTALGLEIKPPHMREGYAEDFVRLIFRGGLVVNSPLSVARLTNLDGTAASS